MAAVAVLVSSSFVDLEGTKVKGHAGSECLAAGGYLPRDLGPLIDTLDKLGIKRVYADYWVAYRIDYETSERIIAAQGRSGALAIRPGGAVIPSPTDASLHPRHLQYETIVARVNKPAWVVFRPAEQALLDKQMFAVAGYRKKAVGGFTIYWHGVDSKGAP